MWKKDLLTNQQTHIQFYNITKDWKLYESAQSYKSYGAFNIILTNYKLR